MRNLLLLVCATAFITATATATAQAPKSPQRPGKWQMTMEPQMPGLPMKLPAVTTEICWTEEDLSNPQKSVPSDPKSDCKVGDFKVTGNTVSWTVDCPKTKTMGSGEITYAAETFSGLMKMKMEQQEMSTKVSGKWLGPCTK